MSASRISAATARPSDTCHIDRLAAEGLRYAGFHTTAMCSTTRAALLTGRNHHSVGMGCLANFDSGYPGYRGKIAREAGTLAEMLRHNGYRNDDGGQMARHAAHRGGRRVPIDGWPLGRGFDRFYGFMDAETDQYTPELVRDNTTSKRRAPSRADTTFRPISSTSRSASSPTIARRRAGPPWLLWLAFGACHAPHQAPVPMIDSYDQGVRDGVGCRARSALARRRRWGSCHPNAPAAAQRRRKGEWDAHCGRRAALFTACRRPMPRCSSTPTSRSAAAAFLERIGRATTRWCWCCPTTARARRAGRWAWSTLGAVQLPAKRLAEARIRAHRRHRRPDTHTNIPHGWAMASNTPLRRYKQNTHGGGIRDPLVISWPKGLAARGEIRHGFRHACDLRPHCSRLSAPHCREMVKGVPQMPIEGESFAAFR
jgi:arylsulfatase A-like enzyme